MAAGIRARDLLGVVALCGPALAGSLGGCGSTSSQSNSGNPDASSSDGHGAASDSAGSDSGPDGSKPGADGGDASVTPGSTIWKTLRVGAGGWVQGLAIGPDGTKVSRTDTYGAYLWNPSISLWQQIVTSTSMPAAVVGPGAGDGVYAIAIAPSNTMRFYMTFNGAVFRSDNRGTTWMQTAFTPDGNANANDNYRGYGQKLAVDPANADVVYAGVPSGLFVSADGGATWSLVSSVTLPSNDAAVVIAFDPSSGTTGGKTSGIFASSYGQGVYHSTDAGKSWSLTPGTPTTHIHLVVAQDGVAYLTDDSGGGNTLHAFSKGAWSTLNAGTVTSVAVDPKDATQIVAGQGSGNLNVSGDHGSTWTGSIPETRTATDIPWLAWTQESYMSNGDQVFDPSGTHDLWFGEGIGVWETHPPTTNTSVTWSSKSAAIEQLVPNWIVSPPGGNPIVTAWDRPVFAIENPDEYPAQHGINNVHAIVAGWSADWASASPSTIVVVANGFGADTSGYSSDGGKTWHTFVSNTPSTNNSGGCIAASTATNFVWVPTDNGSMPNSPWYTKDGGKTWSAVAIAGVPTSGETGWSFAYYLDRQIVAADRVTPSTFYIYNYGPSGSSAAGFYKSSDGGATWASVSTMAIPNASYNAQMRTVPGHAGHLFFTSGSMGTPHPSSDAFYRSMDGGASWAAVPNVQEVWSFGFGKAAPGKTYPAIYIYGWVSGALGIWRSIDDATSWTSISDGYPLGSFAGVKALEGDNNTYGTVYAGLAGDGWAYGTIAK
jgi:BNR/Asp-box repeat